MERMLLSSSNENRQGFFDVNVSKRIRARVRLNSTRAGVVVELGVTNGVVVSLFVGSGAGFDAINGPGVGLVSAGVPIAVGGVFGSRCLLVESWPKSWIFKYDWQVSFNFCKVDISIDFISGSKKEYLTRSSLHGIEIFHDEREVNVSYLKQRQRLYENHGDLRTASDAQTFRITQFCRALLNFHFDGRFIRVNTYSKAMEGIRRHEIPLDESMHLSEIGYSKSHLPLGPKILFYSCASFSEVPQVAGHFLAWINLFLEVGRHSRHIDACAFCFFLVLLGPRL